MGDDFAVKRNCAQSGASYLTFDGLTDDALCFEYTVSAAPFTFNQIPSSECRDFYVQGGDGENVINISDICPVANKSFKADHQSNVIDRLLEIKANEFSAEMHALGGALAPFALAASRVREMKDIKMERFHDLNVKLAEAKRVLCIEDGYKRDPELETDEFIAAALRECKVEHASWWRSIFTSLTKAELTISTGMRELHVEDDEQELLLAMDLSNTLYTIMQRPMTEEALFKRRNAEASSPLRALPDCDIQLLAWFKSVVPTLSLTMQFGEAQVRHYIGGRDFMDQAFKVLGNYEIDLEEGAVHIKAALKATDPNDALNSVNRAIAILKAVPKLGNPTQLNAAIAELEGALSKRRAAMPKALQSALASIDAYTKKLAAENASDLDAAINAKIFMINAFAERTGRREFGKVLIATLWMNRAVDAIDSADRMRRIARARELLKEISLCRAGDPCNLSRPERRWFDQVQRLLAALSGKAVCDDPLEEPTPYGGCDPTPASCAAKKLGFSDENDIPRCVEKKQIIVVSDDKVDTGATETAPAVDCDITPIQMKKLSDTERDEWLKNCR